MILYIARFHIYVKRLPRGGFVVQRFFKMDFFGPYFSWCLIY